MENLTTIPSLSGTQALDGKKVTKFVAGEQAFAVVIDNTTAKILLSAIGQNIPDLSVGIKNIFPVQEDIFLVEKSNGDVVSLDGSIIYDFSTGPDFTTGIFDIIGGVGTNHHFIAVIKNNGGVTLL
ncbi:hypothetical protein [Algicola sagamiensis]|uniref:hypothetical protein n=1 Tax=Algicola sagamiensis TaxID=163869 RepID=UPI0012F8C611|nr:hypothetical protein [Algicola sagamiensis]